MFPLTMDCPINPFRVRTSRAGGPDFLLHAIMAVSSQHLAKKNQPTGAKPPGAESPFNSHALIHPSSESV